MTSVDDKGLYGILRIEDERRERCTYLRYRGRTGSLPQLTVASVDLASCPSYHLNGKYLPDTPSSVYSCTQALNEPLLIVETSALLQNYNS